MNSQLFISLILSFALTSCAFLKNKSNGNKSLSTKPEIATFSLVDKSGTFELRRESGYIKASNQYITKRQIFSTDSTKKILEKSIVISTPGAVKGVNILRPSISQYTVWFEKQKYFTEMELSLKDKSMKMKLTSPEKQWNGESNIKFPKMSGVFCYFSQVIECANVTGFIKEATKRQAGTMKMLIIWEGYPYFQEQYLNIPKEVFSEAVLEYDGKNKNGSRRFTLKFGGQSVFYFVDSKNHFTKMFWVAQGLSITKKP